MPLTPTHPDSATDSQRSHLPIDEQDIQVGLDRINLTELRTRFLSINDTRSERLREGLLPTQGIFLDVSAAFDKCWHKGLLAKLKKAKIDNSCYKLFESYLSNRVQCTVVEGLKSNFKEIKAGIPQGSKLSPLLWLLYVNDIIDGIESEILLFADDTCCFATGIDPADTAIILNRDLDKLNTWASKWKFTFNTGKSKDIIFSEKKFEN
mgnify:CR=1 FL=1